MEQAAAVIRRNEKRSRYYDRTRVLTCGVEYPEFISREFPWVLNRINEEYRRRAAAFLQHCTSDLYAQAVEDYLYSMHSDFPFIPYEALLVYTITYNQSCTISLYFNNFQFTGGAHGSTFRTSDTWDLNKGTRMTLSDFFPAEFDYRTYILDKIDAKIDEMIEAGEDIFFADPKQLAREYFEEQNFYLTDEGIVIYYQLYSIAPYASGILEFLIPYGDDVVERPRCAT